MKHGSNYQSSSAEPGGMEDRPYRTMMILRAYVTWGDGSLA